MSNRTNEPARQADGTKLVSYGRRSSRRPDASASSQERVAAEIRIANELGDPKQIAMFVD